MSATSDPDSELRDVMRVVIRDMAAQPDPPAPPETKPYEAFPAGILPPALRDIVREGARALCCDEAQVALPALAACSAAIGNSRRVVLKSSWAEPAVLWGAVVLPSGAVKSPAMDLALAPIRAAQHEAIGEYRERMVEHEAAMAEWAERAKNLRGAEPVPPVCRRIAVSDLTMEALALRLAENPRGLLCERDELAGWFGSMNQYRAGGADEAHWLSAHGARSLTVDRKTENRLIYVPRAYVALTGTIQPGTLRRALTAEYRESGLAARLLLAMPPAKPRRWSEAVVSESARERYAGMLRGLLALPMGGAPDDPEPIHIPLDPAAKKIWVKWYDEHNAAEQAREGGDISAAWAKLEGYAARLALIIHCAREVSEGVDGGAVDRASMTTGIMLARWFGGEAERVYAMLADGGAEDELAALTRYIRDQGGRITASKLKESRRAYRAPGAARDALCRLVEAGYGRWIEIAPGVRGGRPSTVCEVVPIPPAWGGGTGGTGTETPRHDSASGGISTSTSGTVPDSEGISTTDEDDRDYSAGDTDDAVEVML